MCLDEVAPVTTLAITEFARNGVTYPAEGCMKFQQGDLLIGTYSATDQHFRYLELILEPPSPLGVTPSPAQVLPIAPSTGVSGTWHLDTTNLDPGGYVVRLRAGDATIVSGYPVGWESPSSRWVPASSDQWPAATRVPGPAGRGHPSHLAPLPDGAVGQRHRRGVGKPVRAGPADRDPVTRMVAAQRRLQGRR